MRHGNWTFYTQISLFYLAQCEKYDLNSECTIFLHLDGHITVLDANGKPVIVPVDSIKDNNYVSGNFSMPIFWKF